MITNQKTLQNRQDWFFAIIPFVLTQIAYFLTLAPTVSSEDSGELITAAAKLGVAHPPGYPLYCLSGYLFSKLPFNNVAYALNYMSAFYASLTCSFVYLIVRLFLINRFSAVISGCLLGFSWHFWNQSIIAEVYSLNAFFFALTLYILLALKLNFSWNRFYSLCFVFSLSLTNHYMLALLVSPAMLIYLFGIFKKQGFQTLKFNNLAISFLMILIPLSLYSYLYIAANSNPVINWGDPSTLKNLMSHIKRDAYKSLELEKEVPFGVKLTYYYQFVYLLISQFSALLFIPLLAWSISKWFQKKSEFLLLIGIVVFNSFVLLTILHFSAEQENFTRVEEYYLPAYICIAVLLSFGIESIYTKLSCVKYASSLLITLPLLLIICNWSQNQFKNYYLAYDYNQAILKDLPKDAIYFPSGDYNAFPVLYLQAIEGVRPDIFLADITGDVEAKVVKVVKELDPDETVYKELKERLKDKYPQLKPDSMVVVQKVLIDKGTRPVFFTSKSDIKQYPEYTVVQHGLVYQALKKGEKPKEPSKLVFKADLLRNINDPTAYDDLGQSILSNFYQMWGESLLRTEKPTEGLLMFDKAIQYSYFSKEGLNNLGSALSELGQTQKAISVYERAISLHPEYVTGRVNLIRSYQALGENNKAELIKQQLDELNGKATTPGNKAINHKEVLKELKAKLVLTPDDPLILHDIGIAYANLGDLKSAEESLIKALDLKPDYESAIRNLVKIYQATGQSIEKQNELLKRLPK